MRYDAGKMKLVHVFSNYEQANVQQREVLTSQQQTRNSASNEFNLGATNPDFTDTRRAQQMTLVV